MTRWETLGIVAVASVLTTGCTVEIGADDLNHNEFLDGFGPCNDDSACNLESRCLFEVGSCGSVSGRCVSDEAASHPCSSYDQMPVCGCDGQSYDSECAALQAGAAVDYQGICEVVTTPETPPEQDPPTDGSCGGTYCAGSDFCAFDDGTCGSNPGTGTCVDPLGVCTSPTYPVCGCDGKTYEGRCDAQHYGVSVLASGPC